MISLALLSLTMVMNSASGAEFREEFTSRANLDLTTDTAIWNQALGKVHSTLEVVNFKPGFTPKALDVGDGSNGAFELATYASFSAGGDLSGNIIRLDTSVFPELKVTHFKLEQGWILEPVGSNPLIIRSLSNVIIHGEIWCHGHNGENSVAGSPNTPGAGGAGRCGGASGGDGGFDGLDAEDGDSTTAPLLGGEGGHGSGGLSVGGGGGGSWNDSSPPASGANAGSGGAAGFSDADPEFLSIAGSAGGGGGGGDATSSGGGGGGGGGIVIIHAVGDFDLGEAPTSTYGFIFAKGGNGGASHGSAGAGGGGGGGSVQVFVGGTINMYNIDAAGASTAAAGLGPGAVGGVGRSWFSSVVYNSPSTSFYTPAEQAPVIPGDVRFSSTSQTVTSKSYDLGSTKPENVTLTLSPTSSDFLLEFSGSDDNFASDDSGWVTNLALVQGKRYLRYRIGITTSNTSNPDMVDFISTTFTPNTKDQFDFVSAGCGRVDTDSKGKFRIFLMLLPLMMLAHLKFKAHRQKYVR